MTLYFATGNYITFCTLNVFLVHSSVLSYVRVFIHNTITPKGVLDYLVPIATSVCKLRPGYTSEFWEST